MKWPFVSRKRFDELRAENAALFADREEVIAEAAEMEREHEREMRRLQDELHHARIAIFNTKRMQQYEEMMLRNAGLNRPHPAEVLMNVMAMTDAVKADIKTVTGIDDLTMDALQKQV